MVGADGGGGGGGGGAAAAAVTWSFYTRENERAGLYRVYV